MKNSLSRTELTGLILLASLVVGITACALLFKRCENPAASPPPPANVRIIDSAKADRDSVEAGTRGASGNTGKKTQKKSRKKKSPAPKSQKVSPVRSDPFSDTIPLYH